MQEKEADKITIWMAEKFTRNNTINCLPKNPIMHVIQFINMRIYFKENFLICADGVLQESKTT